MKCRVPWQSACKPAAGAFIVLDHLEVLSAAASGAEGPEVQEAATKLRTGEACLCGSALIHMLSSLAQAYKNAPVTAVLNPLPESGRRLPDT